MTVLPGSLDYLYYNGILDHIPYEAYEGAPLPQNFNSPQLASLDGEDRFVRSYSPFEREKINVEQLSHSAQMKKLVRNLNEKNFRQAIINSAQDSRESNTKNTNLYKGIAAAGVLILTTCALFHCKKVSFVSGVKNFFSKFNPIKLFKK